MHKRFAALWKLIFCVALLEFLIQWARLRPRCAQPAALLPSHSLMPGPESAGSGRALSDSCSELPSLRIKVTVTASAATGAACHGHGDWPGPRRDHWQLRVTLPVSPRARTSPACGQAAAPRRAHRGAGPTTVTHCGSRRVTEAGRPQAAAQPAGLPSLTVPGIVLPTATVSPSY
jgi:hypothetical protein